MAAENVAGAGPKVPGAGAAEAGAVATAFIVHQCTSVLDPNVAFGIAVYGFIEGMKTAPHPAVH